MWGPDIRKRGYVSEVWRRYQGAEAEVVDHQIILEPLVGAELANLLIRPKRAVE